MPLSFSVSIVGLLEMFSHSRRYLLLLIIVDGAPPQRHIYVVTSASLTFHVF
jgi:hypothetical protein